jgi:hypothetical protein
MQMFHAFRYVHHTQTKRRIQTKCNVRNESADYAR